MADPVFTSRFIHAATVLRKTESADGIGGVTNTWSTVVGTLTGLVQPTPLEQSTIAKLKLYCVAGSDIQDEDRVTGLRLTDGTAHTQYGNKTYHVKSVVDPGGQGHHLMAFLDELSG